MKVLLEFVGLVSLAFLLGCSNSVGEPAAAKAVELSPDTLSGMVRVSATGSSVFLGTDDELALPSERPQMKVSFDYDFSIAEHEVTCGDFVDKMYKRTGLGWDCGQDSFPAVNMTFFDAVLYANEMSKAAGFDTVYTYRKATFDYGNHCTNLEGYAFHPDIEGYRLPTEAEWVMTASIDWNVEEGWTAENSDYTLHPVCSFEKTGMVCDMVGNVMEWVNDWSGSLLDKPVRNFVGAADGGKLGERVVKGGSYRNAASTMKLYSRGDVYKVTSSTYADYVGFRLAFGKIPEATWMSHSGDIEESLVVTLAGETTIHDLLGTYRSKLAFRNDVNGNLLFVDYYSGTASVNEIKDSLDVYHPDISPDGNRVAFCTGMEGLSTKSELYVRDLNVEGTNLVKLDVESAAIPRWRVLANGDTVIVYVSNAGNNKDETAFAATETWQVKFENGAFGKPQKLFVGAYHGGISEDDSLAVTGARLLRARKAERDTVWYNGEQACNASLATDSSKRTLFLDFGGKTGREFVGEKYGTHERLFVVDRNGKLIQSVGAPDGYSFDHSEWVRGRNFAVATLANSMGAHTKIVLVNLDNNSIVDLAEGEELWHPALWASDFSVLNKNSRLNLDSAGIYLTGNQVLEQVRFRIKMEAFWKQLDVTNVVLVGSSRMEMGMNPDLFPEWNMLNFAVQGIDPNRDLYFVENYILNFPDKLKAIVVSIDLDYWRGNEDHLALVQSGGPGYKYDADHHFWKDSIPEDFVQAVENSYPAIESERVAFSSRGGINPPNRAWDADPIEVLRDSVFTAGEMEYLNRNIDRLMDIVKRVSKQNIYVIGVIFPQAPQYKNTGAFGVYGMQRSVATKMIARLDSLTKVHENFVLMDENKMGKHDYTDEMAYNRDHLSWKGSAQITTRLDSVLRTLKW